MTILDFYQPLPLYHRRSMKLLMFACFWLCVNLPGAFAGLEAFETFEPIRSVYVVEVRSSDAFTDSDLFLLSHLRSGTAEATLDVKCPPDITVQCGESLPLAPTNLSEFVAAGGTISTTCGLNRIELRVYETSSGGCPEVITRTVNVRDYCGDQATCSYTVTIEGDIKPPVIECPGDITVDCAADVPEADVTMVNATDMCGTFVVKHLGDDTSRLSLCPGVIYRRYLAQDLCENIATCIQTITVNNNCDPNDPCTGICDVDVPAFSVDLSANADNTWTSPEVMSAGSCCDQAGGPSEMCVHFSLTLAEDVAAIQFDILSAGGSPGGLMFQIGCDEVYPVSEIVCLSGSQSIDLIFCQPSNEPYVFRITSYSAASLPDENQDGVPDKCGVICDDMKLIIDDCAAVYVGYGPLECIDLTAAPLGGIPPFSYLWSTNNTSEVFVACPSSDQIYSVTVTDSTGCSAEASITVYAINVTCRTGRDVQICHNTPGSSLYTQLCVEEGEVAEHLAHGDALGFCGIDPCNDFDYPDKEGDTVYVTIFDIEQGGPKPLIESDDGTRSFTSSIFPNPVTDLVTINYEIPCDGTATIDIIDTQGRCVDKGNSEASKGQNSFRFNTSELGAGLYIVRIRLDMETQLLKFVKL